MKILRISAISLFLLISSFAKGAENNTLIFDELAKNPSYTSDSATWNVNLLNMRTGYSGFTNHTTIDKFFEPLKSNFGFSIDYRETYYHSLGLIYAYSIKSNKFKINLGTIIEYSRYIRQYSLYSNDRDTYTKLNLGFGTSLSYKKHILGVSYFNQINLKNEITTSTDNNYYNTIPSNSLPTSIPNVSRFIVNYKTSIIITKNTKICPEILDEQNLTTNQNNLTIAIGSKFYEKFGLGGFIDTDKNKGLFSNYTFKNKYTIEGIVFLENINSESIGLGLNLRAKF